LPLDSLPVSSSELVSQLRTLLYDHALEPDSHKSQNFCIDPVLLSYLIEFSNLDKKNDTVLEIGAGLGFLTQFLAVHSKQVISIELDSNLALLAERRMVDYNNVEIINADFLEMNLNNLEFDKIIANPPYKISSKLLFKILEQKAVKSTFTFQKEFVDHLKARPGNRNYSRLSVMVAFHAKVVEGRIFTPKSFYPPPRVDSQVIKLVPLPATIGSPLALKNHAEFKNFLRAVFSRKHKKISTNLINYLKSKGKSKQDARKILMEVLDIPDLSKRAAHLSPDRLYRLFEQLGPLLGLL
jgi:16S rRNA (adenine1518-N6/adenine1519-N6)-dimethyltransferase